MERFRDLQETYDDKQLGATIAWIASGMLVAASALLFWLEPSMSSPNSATQGTALLAPGVGPLSLSLRF